MHNALTYDANACTVELIYGDFDYS
jgi:hypothetical protein